MSATSDHVPWDLAGLQAGRGGPIDDVGDWLLETAWAHAVDDQVPPCWFHHDGLVSHLLALKAWEANTLVPGSSPADADRWHEAFLRMAERIWPRFASTHPCSGDPDARAQERRIKRRSLMLESQRKFSQTSSEPREGNGDQ
jgi:hypothetical protein